MLSLKRTYFVVVFRGLTNNARKIQSKISRVLENIDFILDLFGKMPARFSRAGLLKIYYLLRL